MKEMSEEIELSEVLKSLPKNPNTILSFDDYIANLSSKTLTWWELCSRSLIIFENKKTMEHIKIKPLNIQSFDGLNNNISAIFPNKISSLKISNKEIGKVNNNNVDAYLFGESNKSIKAFIFDSKFILPEPDPLLIIFNTAHITLNNIERLKNKIELTCDNKNQTSINLDELNVDLYNFFSLSIVFITSLFNAVEGAINRSIPFDYKHITYDKSENKKELSSIEIQRYSQIEEKIKTILPKATKNKSITVAHKKEYDDFIVIKKLRDNIVHLKIKDELTYANLFNDLLCFKYNRNLKSIKTIINYYQNNLIEDCNCCDNKRS